MGCYNSWADLQCLSYSPLGEQSLWNGTIGWHQAFVIGWSKYRLGLPSAPLHYGLTWPVEIPTIFQTPVPVLCKCLLLGLCKGTVKDFIVRRAGLLWSQQDFEQRWSVPLFKCLTVLEFSLILFDLCLLITFFNFIMNYVPIVTFWIFTYHKIWILSIMFCFIWSYWIIYFLACLEVSWRVVS